MATPIQSFKLDRSIFNQEFYSSIRSFWFLDLPANASVAEMPTMKRWFGVGVSEAEKTAFDEECRRLGGAALDSIGPSKLALPTFESYDKEIEGCNGIAAPFLAEVQEAQKAEGERHAAETLLSLILLIDQFSRNLNRDLAGLKVLYTHYDRLSFALVQASMKLSPNPAEYEGFRYRPVYRSWLYMPLLHSEHLPSHDIVISNLKASLSDMETRDDKAAVEYINANLAAEEMHYTPIKEFGRFPHRNECLGRDTTEAEAEHLKDGKSSFGVKQGQKAEQKKDEL
ncbi:hypothetical protein K431DRAFT_289487 [Polychaeton citri CBS 116435]|uniref:DUF924-domain-containing protein n=1 Tax=Polychaeton citri CBS 116435 TaxID=1314669 RepID=A0A9P4UKW5_9PEZI|nr:hypothetical protein K431DRAFT_289487 [Polychaeton citri CBS 116435]